MGDDKSSKIIFITGASGVGKTSLLQGLKEKYGNKKDWAFFSFDSAGVPSREEMVKQYGSQEAWQKVKTEEWVGKLVKIDGGKTIVIEGQANIDFIINAFKSHNFADYQIILIDCSDEVMAKRLVGERNQPHLANQDMRNWLTFLRKQAQLYNLPIIDSTTLDKGQMLLGFEKLIHK